MYMLLEHSELRDRRTERGLSLDPRSRCLVATFVLAAFVLAAMPARSHRNRAVVQNLAAVGVHVQRSPVEHNLVGGAALKTDQLGRARQRGSWRRAKSDRPCRVSRYRVGWRRRGWSGRWLRGAGLGNRLGRRGRARLLHRPGLLALVGLFELAGQQPLLLVCVVELGSQILLLLIGLAQLLSGP